MDSAVGAASEVAWIPKTFMTIGGAQYYIHPSPVKRYTWLWLNSWREVQGKEPSNIPLNKSITAFVPVTLLNWNKVHFTKDNFEANVAEFASKDDVWNRSFLTGRTRVEKPFVEPRSLLTIPDMIYSPSSPKIQTS